MSEYEEYTEGTDEFKENVHREFTHNCNLCIREVLWVISLLQEEARELEKQQHGIMDKEALGKHRVKLYHTQLRVEYLEKILKEQDVKPDELHSEAMNQVMLDDEMEARLNLM